MTATLADSVTVWPALARLAKDESRPSSTRKQALFWLGQTNDPRAVALFEELLSR